VTNAAADAQLKAIIDGLNSAAMDAFRRGDSETLAAGFTADGKLLAPNAPMAVGRHAVASGWRQLCALPNVTASWHAISVEQARSADLAFEVGAYSLAFDSDSGRVQDVGKYVVVWRKEGGAWRIAADVLNSDLPPRQSRS